VSPAAAADARAHGQKCANLVEPYVHVPKAVVRERQHRDEQDGHGGNRQRLGRLESDSGNERQKACRTCQLAETREHPHRHDQLRGELDG
jgi:hypothetical protein